MAVSKKNGSYAIEKITGVQNFDCDISYGDQNKVSISLAESDFKDKEKTVFFKYEVKCIGYIDNMEMDIPVKHIPQETITMSYSLDGVEYKEAFKINAKAGRWVGVKNGVFCNHDNTVKGGGYVEVDYVRYE